LKTHYFKYPFIRLYVSSTTSLKGLLASTCLRFEDGNYADFKLLNGQENNIKVSDIESLQSFFQNTPSVKDDFR